RYFARARLQRPQGINHSIEISKVTRRLPMFARLLRLNRKKRSVHNRNQAQKRKPTTQVLVEQLENRLVPAAFFTESASVGPAITDWSNVNVGPLSLFNPALGTLLDVVVTETADIYASGIVTNNAASPETFKITESADVSSGNLPNGSSLADIN